MATNFGRHNVKCPVGDSFEMALQFPFALTGATIYFTIRTSDKTTGEEVYQATYTEFTTVAIADDEVTVKVPKEAITNLLSGVYFYSIQYKKDDVARAYITGTFTVVDHAGEPSL